MAAAHDVLLIGGSGFLGTHVARALLAAGHRVTVLARGSRPPLRGTQAMTVDRRDAAALASALEGRRFDVRIDLAAYQAVDIERLLLVPYAALGRYFLISTGQVVLVTETTRTPFREEDSEARIRPEPPVETPDHAAWSYGMGKRRAEGALLALRASHGVRGVVLRLPVLLGEGDPTLRLWAYVARLLDGEPLVLPDAGAQLTRFLFAADVASQLARLVDLPPPREAIYHLAQPDVLPLREVLDRIAAAAQVKPRFVDAGWPEIAAAGIEPSFSPWAGPWISVLDPSRAAAEWGFLGTRFDDYVPGLVRGLLERRPNRSHPGYAQRAREIELASRLAAAR